MHHHNAGLKWDVLVDGYHEHYMLQNQRSSSQYNSYIHLQASSLHEVYRTE